MVVVWSARRGINRAMNTTAMCQKCDGGGVPEDDNFGAVIRCDDAAEGGMCSTMTTIVVFCLLRGV
jgi:hypothetical protein